MIKTFIYHFLSCLSVTTLSPKVNFPPHHLLLFVPNKVPFHGHFYASNVSCFATMKKGTICYQNKEVFHFNRKAQEKTKDVQRTKGKILLSRGEIEISAFHQNNSSAVILLRVSTTPSLIVYFLCIK